MKGIKNITAAVRLGVILLFCAAVFPISNLVLRPSGLFSRPLRESCLQVRSDAAGQEEVFLSEDFGEMPLSSSKAYRHSGLVGNASPPHGLLPANKWAANVDTGSGYIVYRLFSTGTFEAMTLSFSAKVTHLGNAEYLGNNLTVSVSTDFEAWQTVRTVTTGENVARDFSDDLTAYAAGSAVVFLRFDLNNVPRQNLSLMYVGVKLFTVSVTGISVKNQGGTPAENAVKTSYLYDAANWTGDGLAAGTEGVRVSGGGSYKLPLDMSDGVRVTLKTVTLADIDMNNCWVAVSLTAKPSAANFGDPLERGFYLMLFRRGADVFYNVRYRNSAGSVITVANGNRAASYGDPVAVTLRKNTRSGLSGRVFLSVNDHANPSSVLNDIAFDDFVSAVNTCYLGVYCYGGGASPENVRNMTVSGLAYVDRTGPAVEFPAPVISSVITLPMPTLSDSSEIVWQSERVYDPAGKFVPLTARQFTATVSGRYLWVIKAKDSFGNFTIAHREINIP